jgi:hypothetical protein
MGLYSGKSQGGLQAGEKLLNNLQHKSNLHLDQAAGNSVRVAGSVGVGPWYCVARLPGVFLAFLIEALQEIFKLGFLIRREDGPNLVTAALASIF